uniref:Uncharacterized protein n=1 Tax=Rhizophora mucronata TaxID=61149 RepID=A0A2P2KT39_RHIMU
MSLCTDHHGNLIQMFGMSNNTVAGISWGLQGLYFIHLVDNEIFYCVNLLRKKVLLWHMKICTASYFGAVIIGIACTRMIQMDIFFLEFMVFLTTVWDFPHYLIMCLCLLGPRETSK